MQNNANLLADVRGKPRLADRIIETLVGFGVTHLFMMPAETINALYDAARRNPKLLAVLVRHEGNGALMASAYAKLSGRLGVVIGAGGPGATHLPIGGYDAKADRAPLLLISGQVPLNQLGAGSFQEIDTLALFADSAASAQLLTSEEQIGSVAMLCADAVLNRRPTHFAVAQDVLTRPTAPASEAPVGPRPYPSTPTPSADVIHRCARALIGEGSALIVVGAVEAQLRAELLCIAQQLGAPLMIVPEGMHLLREPIAWPCLRVAGAWRAELVAHARAARRVLCVGHPSAALAELLPEHTPVVQVVPASEHRRELERRGPRLCGDLADILARLLEALEALGPASAGPSEWATNVARAQAQTRDERPILDWASLDRALPADVIIAVEPGRLLDELFLELPLRQRIVTSAFNQGARGYAMPAAIGAALARPERRTVALASPSGMAESMAALLTAGRYAIPVVTICVDADASPIDFAEYARSLELPVELPEGDGGLTDALARALAHERPVLVCVPSMRASQAATRSDHALASNTQLSFAAWLVEALARAGVDRIYGNSRGRLEPLLARLAVHAPLELVEPCHQESASMMASARAKQGARLGVCLAVDGSDLVQLLNGIYDAAFDHAPLLVLSPKPTSIIDPARLLAGVACASVTLGPDGHAEAQLEQLLAEATRARGVVLAMLDWDQLGQAMIPLSASFDPVYTDDELHADGTDLDLAVARLRGAERPVILVGRGAVGAREQIVALADRLQAPVVTTFPGRAVMPPCEPCVIGCVGSSGHRAAEEALQWCDVLISLGSSSRGSVFYRTAFATQFSLIQIDEDPLQLGRRKPDSIDLCASVAPTLRALLERLGPSPAAIAPHSKLVPRLAARLGVGRALARVSSQTIEELDDGLAKRLLQGLSDMPVGEAARAAAMRLRGTDHGPLRKLMRDRFERWMAGNQLLLYTRRDPIAPPAIAVALQAALEPLGPATITVDVGVSTLWLFRYLTGAEHELVWTSSFATMGFAVPAAVALAQAGGTGPFVAWTGDGGIAITLAEFASAAQRQLPIVVVVINNGSMAAVKWELEVMGWPDLGSQVHDCDFARYARACGGRGQRVTQTEALPGALRDALTAAVAERRPVLVDVVCDPNYGPFPPKIHYSQGLGYAVALAREAALELQRERSS